MTRSYVHRWEIHLHKRSSNARTPFQLPSWCYGEDFPFPTKHWYFSER